MAQGCRVFKHVKGHYHFHNTVRNLFQKAYGAYGGVSRLCRHIMNMGECYDIERYDNAAGMFQHEVDRLICNYVADDGEAHRLRRSMTAWLTDRRLSDLACSDSLYNCPGKPARD